MTLPLVTPQTLTGGTQYWLGYYTDTSVVVALAETVLQKARTKANTYASNAPTPTISGTSSATVTWEIWGNATGTATNFGLVDKVPGAEPNVVAYNYVSDSTVGHEDLYTLGDITGTPASIGCLQVSALLSKDVPGARTADIRLNSGIRAQMGQKLLIDERPSLPTT
jgi:hypothetical protein